MKIEAVWNLKNENWDMWSITGVFRKKNTYIGTVEAPKGAHFNTIVDEFKKKNKKLRGEMEW